MKPHIVLRLAPGAPVEAPIPHWESLAAGAATAPERFHAPVDRLLERYGVPVLATHEYRPRAGTTFSPDEIASGLDRVYRLVLQRAGTVPPALLESVRLLPSVEYVRLGAVAAADLPPLAATAMSTTTDRASREAIGLPEAHALCRGDRTVKVAVLDTGVAVEHPELAPAIEPGRDFVDIIDGASRFFGDYLGIDDVTEDDVGHGTHVAGVIAAQGLKMPEGVVPECRIVPVRVLGALKRGDERVGAGLVDNINAGIKWAVDGGADVVTMSLGVRPDGDEAPHREVIDYARRKGVTVVAASGNDGSSTTRYYPGALPYVIAVGATEPDGEVAAFSTYGPQVDLVAPGTDIYSSLPDGRYGFSTGTSHATPFVAGAAAMLHAVARRKGRRMSDPRVKWVLRHTADRETTRMRTSRAGFGRLNVLDAVRLLDHKLD